VPNFKAIRDKYAKSRKRKKKKELIAFYILGMPSVITPKFVSLITKLKKQEFS